MIIDDEFDTRPLATFSSMMILESILHHCLTHPKVEQVLNPCHSGVCGGHLFGMATTQKIMCTSYFLPSLFSNCIESVKYCPNCQHFSPKARAPVAPHHSFIAVGPLCKWAIDFMECRAPSINNHKYIIMAVDYFTKWAKAMPTFNNTVATMALFLFNHVITRFGVPKQLFSNHGQHFEDEVWCELSSLLGFQHQYSSSYYPQRNG